MDIKSRLQKIWKNPWHPIVGGIILGLINIFLFWYNKKPWGISKTFARWGSWLMDLVGFQVSDWRYWQMENLNSFFSDSETWINFGIIVGAFIATALTREFKFKKIKSKKQVVIALLGGWLMGYGARVAVGCNIGGFMNSIASLSMNGWLFAVGMLLGVGVGLKILMKWLI